MVWTLGLGVALLLCQEVEVCGDAGSADGGHLPPGDAMSDHES